MLIGSFFDDFPCNTSYVITCNSSFSCYSFKLLFQLLGTSVEYFVILIHTYNLFNLIINNLGTKWEGIFYIFISCHRWSVYELVLRWEPLADGIAATVALLWVALVAHIEQQLEAVGLDTWTNNRTNNRTLHFNMTTLGKVSPLYIQELLA